MVRDLTWLSTARRPARRWKRAGWLAVVLISVSAMGFMWRGVSNASSHSPSLLSSLFASERPIVDDGWSPLLVDVAPSFDPLIGMQSPGVVQRLERTRLREGEPPSAALARLGLDRDDVNQVIATLGTLTDLRKLSADVLCDVEYDATGPITVRIQSALLVEHLIERKAGKWSGVAIDIPIERVDTAVTGVIQSSLWQAVMDAGGNANLIDALVEMFAWDVDFFQEVRPGDSFRLITTKRFARGRFLGFGDVEAAEFHTGGTVHRAFAVLEGKDVIYYNEQGQSTRKQLLKTPVRYGHVTSVFGSRRHPVLGYTRNHNGVDYGVPTGTTIWSVGNGRVVRAGWMNGFGKIVEVRHNNGWLSQYAHLSQISVRAGQQIRQKQRIGLSGATGMVSGPHLHYGLKQNDRYVNPLRQRFSRDVALTGKSLLAFKARAAALMEALSRVEMARAPVGATGRSPL